MHWVRLNHYSYYPSELDMSHVKAIILSGVIWFVVSLQLLWKGMNYTLISAIEEKGAFFSFVETFVSEPVQASLIIVAIGVLVGILKGQFVLAKTVKRVIRRILTLQNPIPLKKLYTRGYFFLLLGMMLLGLSMRFIGLPFAIRGCIDIAIGFALLSGSFQYFRGAFFLSLELKR